MFRKSHQLRKRTWTLADSTPIIEDVPQTITEADENGVVSSRVVFVPLDVTSDAAAASLPDASEYTLDALLKAGVPLDRLSVSGLFNPTDYATNAELAKVAVSQLESVESKK